MRSNGLTARSYTPVADLDPVLATALLDDLKHQGVAAYTKPVESTTTSGFDRPEFRVRVRDRLYVDAVAFTRVRDLLAERDPDLLDDNEDLTWAQLVAGFDQPLSTDDVSPSTVSKSIPIEPPCTAPLRPRWNRANRAQPSMRPSSVLWADIGMVRMLPRTGRSIRRPEGDFHSSVSNPGASS